MAGWAAREEGEGGPSERGHADMGGVLHNGADWMDVLAACAIVHPHGCEWVSRRTWGHCDTRMEHWLSREWAIRDAQSMSGAPTRRCGRRCRSLPLDACAQVYVVAM